MTLKGTAVETEYGSGLRAGDFFFLSAVDAAEEDGSSVCRDNRERILFCLKKLQDVLVQADGSLDCLVQLRFYAGVDGATENVQLDYQGIRLREGVLKKP